MPSTFLGLNTSYTGLVAANAGLNITANNISNIETEGYSRQVVNQEAADAIRTYQSYGCVGSGVNTLGAERVRDLYYDEKFWNNNSKLGEFDKKQYYAAIIETYLNDTRGSNAVKGFTTIFNEYTNSLQALSTNTGDSSYASQFIGKAENLCEYFRLLYNNFQKMQTDVNDEIKISVGEINSLAKEIASLNKQINVAERDGRTTANELRDKRDLMIDQLSSVIDVSVDEQVITDESNSENPIGGTNFVVKIAGGQTLVDGYSYRELECVPRKDYQKVNQNDALGLYDVQWTDTSEDLGIHGLSTQGELKGLFEMRDGNNGEAFNGKIIEIDYTKQTVKIQVTDDYLKDMSKITMPLTDGQITLGCDKFVYDSWEMEKDNNGNCYYTFQLSTENHKNPTQIDATMAIKLKDQSAKVGEKVDYQGIPYYMEQMNEWVRDYAYNFNKLYGTADARDYNEIERTGAEFFTGVNTVTGEEYKLNIKPDDKTYNSKTNEGYFNITAGNIRVKKSVEKDPSTMVTHTVDQGGVSKYDVLTELKDLATNEEKMSFRGCKAEDFLVCLMGDAALNAQSANSFQGIYQDIADTIQNNRISISGVDADEEAANLIQFQNAYNLSSKMISVLCEVYDKLIQETGV